MGNLAKLYHLKNSNTKSLEEMPVGIGRLTSLQTLCNFVVGKGSGSGLRELKLLTHLHGTLCISKLENVKDVDDAKEAQLDRKENLKELWLRWTRNTNGSSSREAKAEEGVLDMLKPHKNLEQFCISSYGGTDFSTWLGNSSLSNLVTLKFEYCCMCPTLPSVGQLPSLKHLAVFGMTSVKRLGSEFYGNDTPIPFPCLETLHFEDMQGWEDWIPHGSSQGVEDMQGWEDWIPHGSSQGVERFPKLRELHILRCSKLQGTFPECLPALEKLVIKGCEELSVSVSSLPALCKLQIGGCKKLQWQFGLSCRLEHLELRDCQDLVKLPKSLLSLSSLTQIQIHNCSSLVSFPDAVLPSQLRVISIWDCGALKFLPDAWMLDNNSSLEMLDIRHCHSLTYVAGVQLLPSLKQLEIYSCDNIRTLTVEEGVHSSSRRHTSLLEFLEIHSCPSLTCLISKNRLPGALDHLVVGNLPQALKFLSIWHCSKLESIVERLDNNTSLEVIEIVSCENLKILPHGLHKLWRLLEIDIHGCENLVSFPEGGLLSAKLKRLVIGGCKKLEALPLGMHHLTCLQHLTIGDVPSLLCFTEDGMFPTNLHSLEIDGMKIWKSLTESGGFHRLTSLRRLAISGCDVVSFPLEDIGLGTTLPACLTHLDIFNFPNLERLSSSICDQNLTSLKLKNCPKLKYFPKKGLPASLLRLEIKKCPLIAKNCRQDRGQYWDLLIHVPCVLIE